MTTRDEVLLPLSTHDAPTSKSPDEDGSAVEAPMESTRDLTPDTPPAEEYEGLMGSPMHRIAMPAAPAPAADASSGDGARSLSFEDDLVSKDVDDPTTVTIPAKIVVATPPLSDADKAAIAVSVTQETLTALAQQITTLYERVSKELATIPAKSAQAMEWLTEARIITQGRPSDYPIAELRVVQTQTLLEQCQQSQEAIRKSGVALISVNILWLILFMIVLPLLMVMEFPTFSLLFIADRFPGWVCVLAGGIGGSLAALVSLGHAASRREYNPNDAINYYFNAPKGAILGGITYYLVLGGFITAAATVGIDAVQGSNGGSLLEHLQNTAPVSPLFIVLAFIAGIAQQRILALLGRVWSERTGSGDATPAPAPTAPPSTTAGNG
jgi:hypothetical protein